MPAIGKLQGRLGKEGKDIMRRVKHHKGFHFPDKMKGQDTLLWNGDEYQYTTTLSVPNLWVEKVAIEIDHRQRYIQSPAHPPFSPM
jgi:hypothetical protein